MKILYVGRNLKTGGGSTFRFNISRGLKALGHNVWVASMPGEMLPRLRKAGIGYVWTPPPPWGAPWIRRAIRRHGIDIVHASNATPGAAAEKALRGLDAPLVMSVHGILGRGDHLAACFQKASRILTFEEKAVERLADHAGLIDQQKIVLLRRPIVHRPSMPRDEAGFRIVYVGRLSKRKGKNALELIAAFRELAIQDATLELDVLGDGSLLGEVRRAARLVNGALSREAVRVHGSVPDPELIVSQAHVLVGASYCALEAIMQGVAVVGAGFWGYGVIDEENLRDAMGWNFGDVGGSWEMSRSNFAEALRMLIQEWREGDRRERWWRLDRLIEEDHALERVARRVEAIYDEVLREHAAAGVKR